VLLCIIGYKYIRCKDDLYAQNDMYTYYKNKVSMIEYHYRNYREGENAFTVLRKIGDVIQDYYSKMGNGGTTDG
jgi:hypothetical protein